MTASLPRPVLLALVGTVLLAGMFMFTRSRSGGSSSSSTPAAVQSPGAATSPTKPPASNSGAAGSKTSGQGLPAKVGRALDAKKVVVVLFWNRNAVDDRSVHRAVSRLPHHKGHVAVFNDGVAHLSRYTRITATAQVTQTPAIVIVDRRGAAEVETGYLDFATINQFVNTALAR